MVRELKPTLDAARLREVLNYDPGTGAFEWRIDNGGSAAGEPAGRVRADGYVAIWIDGKPYRGHRLAWLYMHGEWPAKQIDHINGMRSDNRFSNLRDVSQQTNIQNKRIANRNNKANLLGVSFHAGRWEAFISHNRKSVYLGRFSTPEQAHDAYVRAKRQVHAGCTL